MTERDLTGWLSYLEQLHPVAIDMGLQRAAAVWQRLTRGRLAPRVITVTGTNGKGSTCAFLASLLRGQGLRVGAYASPHLLRYNERVQINGQPVTDELLCEAFAAVEARRGDISLTYFEMGTLAAFWIFQQQELDALVLEVGLGGRLDAVNLVDADLALITSIGVDHVEWLGDSRESVAREKAGILRAGHAALCGDEDVPQPLLDEAQRLGCPLHVRGRSFALAGRDWHGVDAQGHPLQLEALPELDLPVENAALALQAYALLGLPWEAQRLRQSLAETQLAGRLQRCQVTVRGKRVALLLDVGHNPHAAHYLAQRLRQRPRRRLAVFGLLADKDLPGVLQPLLELCQDWCVAPLDSPRSRTAAELADYLGEAGVSVRQADSVCSALDIQCAQAQEGDEVLVFGSFFCVAEALTWLQTQGEG